MGILPPNPGIFPKPFCKPFPLPLAWRPDVQSNQQTSHIQSFHLLLYYSCSFMWFMCHEALRVEVAAFFSVNRNFQKESLSLLFGYHGCLRLETPRLYKLKPAAVKREKSRSGHALLQQKNLVRKKFANTFKIFKRISTDRLSNQLLEAPPKEKKSVWCMEAPFPPQVEQMHHHRNTFCHAIRTTFSLHTFSTLKSLYPCHGHELQLEDQHLRGRKHPMVTFNFNPKKNTGKAERQTKFPLPRDALYPAFACAVGVPEISVFHVPQEKSGGNDCFTTQNWAADLEVDL